VQVRYIRSPEQAGGVAAELSRFPVLGVDIETCPLPEFENRNGAGLDPYLSRPRLLQAAAPDGTVAVFDLFHVPVETLRSLCGTGWAVFNGDFEYRHLTHAGLPVPRLHDVMLADRLLSHSTHTLAEVSKTTLGLDLDKTLQTSDWAAPELSCKQLSYAAVDAVTTLQLHQDLHPHLQDRTRLYDLWCRAIPVLGGLELRGQGFDWPAHEALTRHWQDQKDTLLAELRGHLGAAVNPNSGPQVGEWLKQHLDAAELAKWPQTPAGRIKTDADTLALHVHLPVVQPLLRYKAVNKLLSTYDKGYTKHRHPVTGRLHPSFRIGNTRSGRICAAKPNTQNPPHQKEFRELFVPDTGHVLIGADFSQIELRVAALLSKDTAMLQAYADGEDLHTKTAAAVAGISQAQVTPDQRRAAKAVNFGNLYGQGPAGLARKAKLDYGVDMSLQDARQALTRFAKAYPELDQWKMLQVVQGTVGRQVRTRLGLVRGFDVQGVGYLKGEAQNIPVQGSAAEVLFSALVRLSDIGLDRYLYHNVHDEIALSVPVEDADEAAAGLQDAMVQGFMDVFPEGEALTLGLVEVSQGSSWAAVH